MTKIRPDILDTVTGLEITIGKIVGATQKMESPTHLSALNTLVDAQNYLGLVLAHSPLYWSGDMFKKEKHLDDLETRYPQFARNAIIRDSMDAVQVLSEAKNTYIRDLAGSIVRGDNWAAIRAYDAQLRHE